MLAPRGARALRRRVCGRVLRIELLPEAAPPLACCDDTRGGRVRALRRSGGYLAQLVKRLERDETHSVVRKGGIRSVLLVASLELA